MIYRGNFPMMRENMSERESTVTNVLTVESKWKVVLG